MLSTMLLTIIVLILVMIVAANVRIVPQGSVYVLERLGTYLSTWGAGLHVKLPFIDRIANKVSVKEQVVDFMPQSVIFPVFHRHRIACLTHHRHVLLQRLIFNEFVSKTSS